MRLENLELKMYKNYNELCKALEVEPKKRGKSRDIQKEEFARHFEFEKVQGKQALLVTKIFETHIEKEDKSHFKGNVASYVKYIEPLLKDMMARSYFQSRELTVNMMASAIAKEIGIVNKNFSIATLKKNQTSEVLNVKVSTLKKFIRNINKTLKGNILTSLKRMTNDKIDFCEWYGVNVLKKLDSNMHYNKFRAKNGDWIEDYKIITNTYKTNRIATDEDIQNILEAEQKIADSFNVEKFSDILRSGDEEATHRAYNYVCNILLNKTGIASYFKTIKFGINDTNMSEEEEEEFMKPFILHSKEKEELIEKINEDMVNRLYDNLNKKAVKNNYSKEYCEEYKILIDMLIDNNAEIIVNEVNKTDYKASATELLQDTNCDENVIRLFKNNNVEKAKVSIPKLELLNDDIELLKELA